MKHLKSIILLFVITLNFNFSEAQDNLKLENSVLWKIEHAELKEPSYILGTLHLMCESDFKIPEKVIKTLEHVDALVLEVDMSDPEELKAMQASMANAKKISEELTKEQFNKLNTLVTRVMGAALINFDPYGLSILNVLMIQKMMSCSPTQIKSIETELTLLTKNQQKPIYSLEKASDQMETLKKAYPTEFSYEQIMLFDSYKKDFNDAIVAYTHEDITTTVKLISKEKYMDDNAVKHMQIDRNKNWVEKMPIMMKERSNLFAVGAAHLTDSYGIINLLRAKGYIITPVFK